MKLDEFHYELPKELIAQSPVSKRDTAKLMVVDRHNGKTGEAVFKDIIHYLRPGDCLVLNNTRVVPARLYGKRKTGGNVEIFLLETDTQTPRALIRPSKRIKENEIIKLENGICATILGKADAGRCVRFDDDISNVLRGGHMPLPPYISREDIPSDRADYQTVYASRDGATAAPTAGLHFSNILLDEILGKGVNIAYVTLHTSYGSFAPVKEENIEDHKMHSEYYEVDKTASDLINTTARKGGEIAAVGTTSARVLESAANGECGISPGKGRTELFIYPGYGFKIVDKMITNFHLPCSTLLMLVAAFAGRELILEAYKKAIEKKFRFFSYGDAMIVL